VEWSGIRKYSQELKGICTNFMLFIQCIFLHSVYKPTRCTKESTK
jgi:hypothetical protein